MNRAELVQALQAAIVLRIGDADPRVRADMATLESVIEIIEQEPIACDEHEGGGCAGPVYARTCADCGHTTARCEMHGGRKSVSRWMWLHRDKQHRRSA